MNLPLPSIKDLVTGTTVRFQFYRKGELWYEVIPAPVPLPSGRNIITQQDIDAANPKSIFTFPVPISDCGDATFLAEDKALLFMRYIRKQLEALTSELEAIKSAPTISDPDLF